MITLKTGAIGSGKTLSAVTEIARLQERWQNHENEWREVYAFGVRDLALPHKELQVYPAGGKPGDVIEFDDLGQPKTDVIPIWETVAPGSIVVVDECHKLFPSSGPGRPAPHIAWLDMSRQAGIDLILISQHPRKLHVYARTSVNKHQHYRRAFGGSRSIVYEWDECSQTLSYKTAVTRLFNYPKDSFKFYKSAEEHTKISFAFPAWAFVPIAGIVLGIVAGPKAYHAFSGAATGKGLSDGAGDKQQAISVSAPAAPPAVSPSSPGTVQAQSQSLKIVGCIDAKPRGFCIDSQGRKVEMAPDVIAWNSRNIGGFVSYDLSGQAPGVPAARPASQAVPSAGLSGFAESSVHQRPNPVRSLTGGLGSLGGAPSQASSDVDGAVLADMRGGRI